MDLKKTKFIFNEVNLIFILACVHYITKRIQGIHTYKYIVSHM